MDGSRILVFMETKRGCDQVTRQLRLDGWPALSIHGDKSQSERDWVLAEFKSGKSPIMTATDVAARGLGTCSGSLWQCVTKSVASTLKNWNVCLLVDCPDCRLKANKGTHLRSLVMVRKLGGFW